MPDREMAQQPDQGRFLASQAPEFVFDVVAAEPAMAGPLRAAQADAIREVLEWVLAETRRSRSPGSALDPGEADEAA